ncbi:hypothetical protein BX661DRAFT_198752 [Kickxella alabastrina]|uniref:uncharacterized protein n=1 Tax=Kickxella alabastrina TaxID=61397 RepID=UPI00222065A0|nr:uncharacterized protein BX661DRAFT_198752 [Kickxella alabastrina]KAI7826731.1 hypothetical protein BX661DRAFT_198752 [Kickxella alabastrina]
MSIIPAALVGSLWVLLRPLNISIAFGAYIGWQVIYAPYFSPLLRCAEHELMMKHNQIYGSLFIMSPHRVTICDPKNSSTILGTYTFLKDHMYQKIKPIEKWDKAKERKMERRRGSGTTMTFMLMIFAIIGYIYRTYHEDFDKFLALCNSATNTPLWEIPYEFYPDRFVDNEPLKRLSLIFSNGLWICSGRNLAWMEIFFATLANVFNRYDLELPGDSLFKPNIVDKNGLMILMPSTRDTIVVASLRK